MQITYRTCKCEIRLEEHIRIWCRNMMVIVSNIWPPETGDERRRTEKNYEQMRSDNGRAHSPRCSIQMPKIFLRKDLKNLHKCIKKKHPEQVKTDLTNLKVFWTFRRLDCTNSKGFQPSEEIEKEYSTCGHSTLPSSTVLKGAHAISSLLWISTENNERLLL